VSGWTFHVLGMEQLYSSRCAVKLISLPGRRAGDTVGSSELRATLTPIGGADYRKCSLGLLQGRMFPICSIRTLHACSGTAIGFVGRERTVSRVLCPLRDGDHLSGAPVARRL
jgi:hypothetical protein